MASGRELPAFHMYYYVMHFSHFQCPHGAGALPVSRQLVPDRFTQMQTSHHPSNSTGHVSFFQLKELLVTTHYSLLCPLNISGTTILPCNIVLVTPLPFNFASHRICASGDLVESLEGATNFSREETCSRLVHASQVKKENFQGQYQHAEIDAT